MGDTLLSFTQGGRSLQVGSSGKIVVQSGAEIVVQSGGVIDTSVGTIDLPASAVATSNIVNQAVTFAKADVYITPYGSPITATGSSQDVPHGLGVIPSRVLIIPVSTTGSSGAWVVTYGTMTTTNIVVTVSTGAIFLAFAWA